MYMDAFGWSTQSAAAPSCPSDDDALLAAFLGASFELQYSEGGGDTVTSDVSYGLDLPPSTQHDPRLLRCQDGVALPCGASSTAFVDSVDLLPDIAGERDGLLDRFWFSSVGAEESARAAVSNTAAFSGYSSTTGGGNISSGESNTYGGHDAEVASASACAVSQPVPHTAPSPSKWKPLDKYPALGASASAATTTGTTAAERRSTKRAAATTTTTSITFGRPLGRGYEPDTEAIAQVKEMIYRAAAMRPVSLGSSEPRPEKLRRKNVRISSDPQTVAARLRRERVSERLRALQRLVPGGSKMDTASMLDEAASYLRFLKSQLEALETLGSGSNGTRLLQHYTARNPSSSSSNSTVFAFGSDGLTGYVKSNRSMQF